MKSSIDASLVIKVCSEIWLGVQAIDTRVLVFAVFGRSKSGEGSVKHVTKVMVLKSQAKRAHADKNTEKMHIGSVRISII
jgi:hypothetical protein